LIDGRAKQSGSQGGEPSQKGIADQAKEVRALSTQVTADVAKQVKEQVTRGVDELRKAS
jgi:hypothetical protein